MFVKICGNSNPADAEAVAALQPDAMGFIFWPGSPRYVEPDEAAAWIPRLPDNVTRVGVFVDASVDEIAGLVDRAGIQVAQLHGEEDPSDYTSLSVPLWKVVRLDRGSGDEGGYPVDALLIDSYSKESPGGTGITVGWEGANTYVASSPHHVVLSGGLTPDNVREAVSAVQPWGVDVCSGVEEQPGLKDLAKVQLFIEQCRNL